MRGTGADTIDVTIANEGTGNTVAAPVTLIGGADGAADALNVASFSTEDQTGTLDAATLTDLGMTGGIAYSGFESLDISLGSGANTFDILSTLAGVTTTLNTGGGSDTVRFTESGQRKIDRWTAQHRCAEVVFENEAAFFNANTPEELHRLQQRHGR